MINTVSNSLYHVFSGGLDLAPFWTHLWVSFYTLFDNFGTKMAAEAAKGRPRGAWREGPFLNHFLDFARFDEKVFAFDCTTT